MSTSFTVFWGEGMVKPLRVFANGAKAEPFTCLSDGHLKPSQIWLRESKRLGRQVSPFEGHWLEMTTGEYSLCAWNDETRTLHAGHDLLGLRSLFFARFSGGYLISNSLREMLRFVADRTFNHAYLAHFLHFGVAPQGHSPFEAIQSLRAGERLEIRSCDNVRLIKYQPEIPPTLQLEREEDYVDQLHEILSDIFSEIASGGNPILCEVSGGLDSALVFGWMNRLLKQDFSTVSVLYSGSSRGDETEWVTRVLDGFSGTTLSIDGSDIPFFSGELDEVMPEPCFHLINADDFHRTQQIYQNGYRSVLTGLGGDSVFFGDSPEPFYLYDLLTSMRLGQLARSLIDWQKGSSPSRSLLWWLVVYGLKPAFSSTTLLRKAKTEANWITSRELLADLQPKEGLKLDNSTLAQDYLLSRVNQYAANIRLHYDPIVTGIPYRFPLLDWRLIRFALSLPSEVTFSGARDRTLHRLALKRVGQTAVSERTGKSGPEELLYEGLRKNPGWKDFLTRAPVTASLGLVNSDRWKEQVELVSLGYSDSMFHFETTSSLEAWLQSLSRLSVAEKIRI
mmetsp:Transcript_29645/g.58650  ORF Transcript_29645/g.58650 Transcript_29645/m.58650 type:complete len:564 (-) Transcript_29645:2367-4058(-)